MRWLQHHSYQCFLSPERSLSAGWTHSCPFCWDEETSDVDMDNMNRSVGKVRSLCDRHGWYLRKVFILHNSSIRAAATLMWVLQGWNLASKKKNISQILWSFFSHIFAQGCESSQEILGILHDSLCLITQGSRRLCKYRALPEARRRICHESIHLSDASVSVKRPSYCCFLLRNPFTRVAQVSVFRSIPTLVGALSAMAPSQLSHINTQTLEADTYFNTLGKEVMQMTFKRLIVTSKCQAGLSNLMKITFPTLNKLPWNEFTPYLLFFQ